VSYIRDDRRGKASIGNRDGENAFRVTAEKGNPSVDEKKYHITTKPAPRKARRREEAGEGRGGGGLAISV
jgi:hypothetical protein